MDLTITMDPSGDDDIADPIVTPPHSLRTMVETFMTTQAAHEQLIDELLTKVATLRANFAKYKGAFGCLWQCITENGD